MLISLSSCSQNREAEWKLINDYEYQISYILKAHSQNINKSTQAEELYQQQLTSMQNFEKVRKHFSKYPDMDYLNQTMEVYEYALIHLYKRNAQIWEMAVPLWKEDINKLDNIKNDNYFSQHQLLLSELMAMVSEFEDLIDIHLEETRLKLINSDLPKEVRRRIWPAINSIIAIYIKDTKPSLHYIKNQAETELQIATFLHANRGDYIVDESGKILFSDFKILREFHELGFVNNFKESLENFREVPKPPTPN